MNIILASNSPRRKEILNSIGVNFSVYASGFDEMSVTEKAPVERCIAIARGKAKTAYRYFSEKHNNNFIIAADTLVFNKTGIFGKPENEDAARNMLITYSGVPHNVVTAICCIDAGGTFYERQSISTVLFKTLSAAELDAYIQTDEWKDAAGGYKLQGMASLFIKKIAGSHTGIVGLPLYELYEILTEAGIFNLSEQPIKN